MASMFRTVTSVGASANTVIARLRPINGFASRTLIALGDYMHYICGGVHSGRVTLATTAVQATGTVTFSSVVATDTVTIGATVFTGSNTSSGTAQFRTGGTDTTAATSLAAVINANATTSALVTATSSGAVITITAQVPGLIGNFFPIAISAHGSVSGSGKLTSGSEDANFVMYNGF